MGIGALLRGKRSGNFRYCRALIVPAAAIFRRRSDCTMADVELIALSRQEDHTCGQHDQDITMRGM